MYDNILMKGFIEYLTEEVKLHKEIKINNIINLLNQVSVELNNKLESNFSKAKYSLENDYLFIYVQDVTSTVGDIQTNDELNGIQIVGTNFSSSRPDIEMDISILTDNSILIDESVLVHNLEDLTEPLMDLKNQIHQL